MDDNPYTSSAVRSKPRTRSARWLIWTGCVALAIAALCLAATIVGMVWSYESVADLSTTPKPSDLARGIGIATIPSIAVIPLGLFGIVMLILGFAWREPVEADRV